MTSNLHAATSHSRSTYPCGRAVPLAFQPLALRVLSSLACSTPLPVRGSVLTPSSLHRVFGKAPKCLPPATCFLGTADSPFHVMSEQNPQENLAFLNTVVPWSRE